MNWNFKANFLNFVVLFLAHELTARINHQNVALEERRLIILYFILFYNR